MEELLLGLPDDVARECISRVPFSSFPALLSVGKPWATELRSHSFRRLRESAGRAQPAVVLCQTEPDPIPSKPRPASYRLALFQPATSSWSALPPIPGGCGLPLYTRLAAAGPELVVVGGWDPRTWAASDEVHLFDFVSREWRRGAPLPGPRRSAFSCAAALGSGGRWWVHVAGGRDESENALRSALAYDVAADAWQAMPDVAILEAKEEWPAACAMELPAEVRVAQRVVAWGEEGIMVMGLGRRGGALVAYVLELGSAAAEWRKVDVPPEFQGRVQDACCLVI